MGSSRNEATPVKPGNRPFIDLVPDSLKNASVLDVDVIESVRQHRLFDEWDRILRRVFASAMRSFSVWSGSVTK